MASTEAVLEMEQVATTGLPQEPSSKATTRTAVRATLRFDDDPSDAPPRPVVIWMGGGAVGAPRTLPELSEAVSSNERRSLGDNESLASETTSLYARSDAPWTKPTATGNRVLFWFLWGFCGVFVACVIPLRALEALGGGDGVRTDFNTGSLAFYLLSYVTNELSYIMLAIAACFGQSPWPLICIAVIGMISNVASVVISVIQAVALNSGESGIFQVTIAADVISFGVFITLAICARKIVNFSRHLGNVKPGLSVATALLKYFFVLSIPEVVQLITSYNRANDQRIAFVDLGNRTYYFAIASAFTIAFFRFQFGECQKAKSLTEIFSLMPASRYKILGILTILYIQFFCGYILILSLAIGSSLALWVVIIDLITYFVWIIIFIQLLELVFKWRWLMWCI